MADREIFAALDGKIRVVATMRPNKDTHRNRTEYDINLAPDKYADVWLRGLTRNHLVALHYALVIELAQHARPDHGLMDRRSTFEGWKGRDV